MSKVIEFLILPKNRNLHEDFLMRIPSLNKNFVFDTYYFWDGRYDTDTYEVLALKIDSYLKRCKNSILKLLKNESVYIPVDLSDQYYGVFKVTFLSENSYEFKYGIVEKANNTYFTDSNEIVYLSIGNSHFDLDFIVHLNAEDVIDSFKLKS